MWLSQGFQNQMLHSNGVPSYIGKYSDDELGVSAIQEEESETCVKIHEAYSRKHIEKIEMNLNKPHIT